MTPTPLIFIAACLLLVTHISPAVCRAVDLSIFDRLDSNASTATDEGNDQFLSYILREKLLQLLGQNPNYMKIHSQSSLDQILNEILDKEASHLLHELFPNTETPVSTQEADLDMVPAFAERSKRSEPVNSLDLTFHLLREMIKMAKNENQWIQAEKNRKIMDAIGK
ncbi:urotensin 1 [Pristis pectinata]|uniref:urotensin 1 n=1 Tax=Pristis pectinata TaxID=685728 RepID=UPI00223E70A8|nr:urotensin 1 [Pristis pectinata]